jgi:hypothetical protein
LSTKTIPLALTGMEQALLRGRGFSDAVARPLGRQWVAITVKGQHRCEALGPTPDAAARNLIKVVVRP